MRLVRDCYQTGSILFVAKTSVDEKSLLYRGYLLLIQVCFHVYHHKKDYIKSALKGILLHLIANEQKVKELL